ncbi:hypothetical protein Tco_1223699 [Tanacetum coccineum]
MACALHNTWQILCWWTGIIVDIDEFCLHDFKEMVVKLCCGVASLMYCHFLRPRLSLYYGLHPWTIDADVLELAKYVKDNKITLVYVKHGSNNVETIFATHKKGVVIEVDNQLRMALINSSPNVNRNLIPMCSINLTQEWEEGTSKALSIGEILGKYANIVKEITMKEIIVHVDNSSKVKDVVDCDRVYKTEGVGPIGNLKEVEGDWEKETEEVSEQSEIEENDASSSEAHDS